MHNLAAQLFQARVFLEAYRRCDTELDHTDGSLIATPAVVCAAFSIEVAFKFLLARHGRAARGHDLLRLYRRLPRHLQYQIRHGSCYARRDFLRELIVARNAFTDWRYVYESDDGLMVSVVFLGRVAETAVYICEKYEDVCQKSASDVPQREEGHEPRGNSESNYVS